MMKRGVLRATLGAAMLALASQPAPVDAGVDDHGCGGCHKLEKRIFGPSFKEIAAKYRNDPEAPAKLMNSVKTGSSGKWSSNRAMPPMPVPDAEIKEIIAWVLSQ